jgi:hypothetical protein
MTIRTFRLPWAALQVDPEQAVVMAVARAYALGENPRTTRETLGCLAQHGVNWPRVDMLLHVHRISSLTYAVVRQPPVLDSGIFPDEFIATKREWYGNSFARSVMEPAAISRLQAAFAGAGIPALSIKGYILGAWLYEDPAVREHDDIDFLVPQDMRDQADALLVGLGYVPGYRPPLYPGELPGMANYASPDGGLPIDLSFDPLQLFWQTVAQRRATFDGWWSRRLILPLGKHQTCIPGPEDQFLQLARHIQFHGYFRINWAVDLLVLLRRFGADLDWQLAAAEAARFGIVSGVNRTLEILESVYAFDRPDGAVSAFRTGPVTRTLHRRIWADELTVPQERPTRSQEGTPIAPRFLSPGGVRPVSGLALFALDQRRARYLRYLGQRIIPPRAWLRETYGHGSYPHLVKHHWSELRALRRRVRSRREDLSR